jgi:IS30 family transposase
LETTADGLLLRYMPKSADLTVQSAEDLARRLTTVHSAEDLARFARSLNNRPRETLGFMKPSEKAHRANPLTG